MKIFQILNNYCHWDASNEVKTLELAREMFASDIVFTEAPDYVFEGWGYDDTLEGDARFIQPIPPDGWLYDAASGTFYEEGTYPPSQPRDVWDELAEAYAKGVNEA